MSRSGHKNESGLLTVAVDVPQVGDGRGKHWAKMVTAVDSTKSSGWAYIGEFVADGGIQDLPMGAVLLVYGERGSRSSPQPEARIYLVNSDATLSLEGEAKGRAWARTLRDRAISLLDQDLPPPTPEDLPATVLATVLATVDDAILADVLRQRGWTVVAPVKREENPPPVS